MIEVRLIICGIVVSENYESDILKINKAQVIIQNKEYNNCIELKYYIKNSEKDESVLSNYLSIQIEYFYYILCLLLLRPSEVVYSKIFLDGKELKSSPRTIEGPRRLYYLLSFFQRNINPVLTRYSCRIDGKGIKLYENILDGFNQKTEQFKDNLFLPLRWFQKACDELSSIDRLISFWISFNSLYQDPNFGEQKAIENYIKTNLSSELSKKFFNKWLKSIEKLSQYNISLRNRNVSDDLKQLLNSSSTNYKEIVLTMLLNIYGIRNSLFHGNINIDDLKKEEEIEIAEILLSELLKDFISFLILNKSVIDTTFVVSEQGSF